MSTPLAKIISTKGWYVADGPTGTNLFGRGLETGYPPDLWSVERRDDILWLHNNCIDAGSDLILTNSFGGTTPARIAAMVAALKGTANRLFDLASMNAALGTTWNGVDTSGGGNTPCSGRRGRRR